MIAFRSLGLAGLCVAVGWLVNEQAAVAQQGVIKIWAGTETPGRIAAQGPEADTTPADGRKVAGKSVIRLGNVSTPMLTIYSPPADKNTGAAVIVCPGGGYNILAYDLEGSEVCEWLNSIGVTGALLKYRVPRPKKEDGTTEARPLEPQQDAQRAMGLLREQAATWSIDPNRIGVLGFSAGGNLAARLSTNYAKRLYPAVDAADAVSCRPDFTVLIYPAYLYEKGSDELIAADLPVNAETPPTFMTMAFDDGVGPENILRYGLALKKVGVPAEVHLYPSGGHGFGLRKTADPVTSWPEQCATWMRLSGWLAK
jgi:acetyl esterase/lipase